MIEIRGCPFCGSSAVIVRTPLWHGNHGYQGCYTVKVKCANAMCEAELPHQEYDTLCMADEEAVENAVRGWNRRVEK